MPTMVRHRSARWRESSPDGDPVDYDRVAMLNRFRQFWTKVISPVANLLLRLGVSPDVVTLVGTIGVSAGALVFFPRGELWIGVVVITAFVFSDMLDGYMARTAGTSSKWGSYLDSTLDRLGDGAVFGGLVLYYAGPGDSNLMAGVTLWALVMGATTSYARAKAESLGLTASGGLAGRADRLVAVLVTAFWSDVLDLPWLLDAVLWLLAAASTITVVQRSVSVRRQVRAEGRPVPPAGAPQPDASQPDASQQGAAQPDARPPASES
jgi:CDP-diacylglycerol--glycerol-3-phosphate 3-phosphatidyltransferase/CDP-diacylglycerol--inositol 3-phosphatidyltransferase